MIDLAGDTRPIRMRPVRPPTRAEVCARWDLIAEERDGQIRSGVDISMRHVIIPGVVGLIRSAKLGRQTRVLDVGCGSGYLTERLARRFDTVVGIDPSALSIELARAQPTRASYMQRWVEEMSDDQQFDLVVANMVFMDTPDLESTVSAIDRLVVPGGTVVISVLHPCHWPYYWGYAYEDWFEYPKEVAIEATFRITKAISEVETFHFHRPLQRYSDVLCNQGFLIERFVELMPSPRVVRQYGTTPARFPRFLAVLASKPELRD